MKKIVIIICACLSFVLGLMIFGYAAEPVSKTSAEGLPAPPSISAKQDGRSAL